MVIARTCIAGDADVGNDLALPYKTSFSQPLGVARKVSVLEDQFPICVDLIDRGAATVALEKF